MAVGVALSLYSSARLRFIIHQDVSPMRLFLFPLFFFFFFDRNLLFLFLISTWYFLFAPFSFLFFSLADFFLIHLLTAHIQRREDFITARSSALTPTIRPPTPPPSLYQGSNSKHSAPLFFTCTEDGIKMLLLIKGLEKCCVIPWENTKKTYRRRIVRKEYGFLASCALFSGCCIFHRPPCLCVI